MQEQIEALDQKSKRHDGNRRSYPGEKGALVGGVIGEILDHDCLTFSRGLGPAVGNASSIWLPAFRQERNFFATVEWG
jgi:hypothetical protein